MIIKNWDLLQSIEMMIIEYNKQFWSEESKDKRIDRNDIEYSEDDESANVPEALLSKLDKFQISLSSRQVKDDELQDIISQLYQMLGIMKLKVFSFSINSKGNQYREVDMSFLEHLNDDVENLQISGVDLSQESPFIFGRFKNLRFCSLEKCNISDPAIVSEIKKETIISLKRNEIAPEHYKDAIELMQKSNGHLEISTKELKTVSQIYLSKEVGISDYLKLMDVVDFDSISGLTVKVEDDFDFESNNIEQLVDILNEKKNITLRTAVDNLSKIDSNGTLNIPAKVIIRNASELSIDDLEKHPCISAIQMLDGENTHIQQREPYTREEYEKVRGEIDKIISQVNFPDESDPNREKRYLHKYIVY